MIKSLSHITLIVKDIKRMTHVLNTIFDAEEVYNSKEKNFSISNEKYFIIGGTWIAIMEGEPLFAFKISDSDFDEYISRINKLGLEMKPGRERVKGEARSIYFYDYDNHLFELHTGTLRNRLLNYSRILCTKRDIE